MRWYHGLAFFMVVGLLLGGLACARATPTPAPTPSPVPTPKLIRLYDGPPLGTWRPPAVFMASLIEKRFPELKVSVEAGGGAANVIAVDKGDGEFGMVSTPSHYDGWEGKPPFEKPMRNMRQVANLWAHGTSVIVSKGSGIKSVADLKGKRVGVQPRGYTQETVNRRLLQVYGLSYDDIRPEFLSQPDSMEAFRDGRLDAVMYPTDLPIDASVLEIATARAVDILSLDEDKIKALQEIAKGMPRVVIPKGTYPGIDRDVVTVAIQPSLLANKDVPDAIVEKVTRALVEGLPELQANFALFKANTPARMAEDIGIPYHPGALKYYKAAGLIK